MEVFSNLFNTRRSLSPVIKKSAFESFAKAKRKLSSSSLHKDTSERTVIKVVLFSYLSIKSSKKVILKTPLNLGLTNTLQISCVR